MLCRPSRAVALAAAAALAVTLAGCAPAPYREPGPLPEPVPSVTGPSAELGELLSAVANAFGTRDAPRDELVASGTTIQVAVAELREKLQLSDQVAAVAAAWAQQWAGQAPVTEVEVEVSGGQVVGTWGEDPLARVTVTTAVTGGGASTQEQYDYLMAWHGGSLERLVPLVVDGGAPVVDTGVGLSSPTGAVHRYLDLVRQSRWDGLASFSAGANTDQTELAVLRSVVEAAGDVTLVEMPMADSEGTRTVFVVTAIDQVIAQFSVDVQNRTVVYHSTV